LRILNEPHARRILRRLDARIGIGFIHPKLSLDKKMRAPRNAVEPGGYYLTALMSQLPVADVKEVCKRFAFPKGEEKRILEHKKGVAACQE
jgi:hypothetical protein